MKIQKKKDLLIEPLVVLNIGLEGFAKDLEQQGVKVLHIDWSPPAGGDPELVNLLSKLGS
jgi:FdrA protein